MIRPRWQFTLRTLMMVVALSGCVAGVTAALNRRELAFRRTATAQHAIGVQIGFEATRRSCVFSEAGMRSEFARRERFMRIAEHHLALSAKYEYASRYPWLAVAADPPEPDPEVFRIELNPR